MGILTDYIFSCIIFNTQSGMLIPFRKLLTLNLSYSIFINEKGHIIIKDVQYRIYHDAAVNKEKGRIVWHSRLQRLR